MTLVEGSGLILAVLGIAFAFETPRRWFLRVLKLQATQASQSALSPITVKEMVDAINAAPPFQRPELTRQYAGIRIEWIGYLREAEKDPRDKSKIRIKLAVEKSEIVGYSFWFSLAPHQLPEIRTLPKNSTLRVIGTVLSASGQGLCADVDVGEIEVLERTHSDG